MENSRTRGRLTLAVIFFTFAFLLLPCAPAGAAVGDAVVENQSVSNNSFLDIQPGSSIEWLVHNIFHEAAVEIYWYDGSNDILIGSPTGANWETMQARVTNSIRLRARPGRAHFDARRRSAGNYLDRACRGAAAVM